MNDGQQFFVMTSHFDNAGPNKLESAHLLLERAGDIAGNLPVVLTADYNSQPGSEGYEVMDNGQPLVEFNARDVSSNGPRLDTNNVNVGFEYGCFGADSKVFFLGEGGGGRGGEREREREGGRRGKEEEEGKPGNPTQKSCPESFSMWSFTHPLVHESPSRSAIPVGLSRLHHRPRVFRWA
jgi:hypothetical protein